MACSAPHGTGLWLVAAYRYRRFKLANQFRVDILGPVRQGNVERLACDLLMEMHTRITVQRLEMNRVIPNNTAKSWVTLAQIVKRNQDPRFVIKSATIPMKKRELYPAPLGGWAYPTQLQSLSPELIA